MRMEIEKLSPRYHVRKLGKEDVDSILLLCSGNELFYRYHPPFVNRESILQDMDALPPGKNFSDKFYIGFFQGAELIAIMDLIAGYPTDRTAWIGLFMLAKPYQGKGTGSAIFSDCASYLSRQGFQRIRLAIDQGNPQSEAFWRKNQFHPAGGAIPHSAGTYIPMERSL